MIDLLSYDLIFKRPAGTSRGILRSKRSWFLVELHEGQTFIGECGLFAGLSADDRPEYETVLRQSVREYELGELDLSSYRQWPSIVMGWETLLAAKKRGTEGLVFESPFFSGTSIPINGLVWMGTSDFMLAQIETLIDKGFDCIKLKIGAIDFEEELAILRAVRKRMDAERLVLRLDANGAFTPPEALDKLKALSEFDIHSIEQPIAQGHPDDMARLCRESPVPIALDEELIGLFEYRDKEEVLNKIMPAFIILKPSLHGGFCGSDEWIEIAEQLGIGWWATSALESNVGLNAIAQWLSQKGFEAVQGLGTGSLYTNNIPSPLELNNGQIRYAPGGQWKFDSLWNG